jgi:cytochrome b561
MSLWNLAMMVLAAFLLNTTFYFIPYIMPRVNAMELLSYQAFTNGMLLLLLILPREMWRAKN